MHPLINIALRAANDAGDALAHKVARLDRVKLIPNEAGEFLTSADQESDQTLIYHIQKAYPQHSILSRVSGEHDGEEGQPQWLIDPLVGNFNFAYGYTRFGVSIAIRTSSTIDHAVLVSPMQRDEFIASKGKGAQLNSRRIRVSDDKELTAGLLGLDARNLKTEQFLSIQKLLLDMGVQIRSSGCSPLDLADAACGRLLGGWSHCSSEATMAAASLIFQEAGGFLSNAAGNPKLETGGEILFGNNKIFKQLLKLRMQAGK